MRYKAWIVLLSISMAFVYMTGAYGLWEKELVIKTNIDVVAPPPPPPPIAETSIIDDAGIESIVSDKKMTLPENANIDSLENIQVNSGESNTLESTSIEEADSSKLTENTVLEEEWADINLDMSSINNDAIILEDKASSQQVLETSINTETEKDEKDIILMEIEKETDSKDQMSGSIKK